MEKSSSGTPSPWWTNPTSSVTDDGQDQREYRRDDDNHRENDRTDKVKPQAPIDVGKSSRKKRKAPGEPLPGVAVRPSSSHSGEENEEEEEDADDDDDDKFLRPPKMANRGAPFQSQAKIDVLSDPNSQYLIPRLNGVNIVENLGKDFDPRWLRSPPKAGEEGHATYERILNAAKAKHKSQDVLSDAYIDNFLARQAFVDASPVYNIVVNKLGGLLQVSKPELLLDNVAIESAVSTINDYYNDEIRRATVALKELELQTDFAQTAKTKTNSLVELRSHMDGVMLPSLTVFKVGTLDDYIDRLAKAVSYGSLYLWVAYDFKKRRAVSTDDNWRDTVSMMRTRWAKRAEISEYLPKVNDMRADITRDGKDASVTDFVDSSVKSSLSPAIGDFLGNLKSQKFMIGDALDGVAVDKGFATLLSLFIQPRNDEYWFFPTGTTNVPEYEKIKDSVFDLEKSAKLKPLHSPEESAKRRARIADEISMISSDRQDLLSLMTAAGSAFTTDSSLLDLGWKCAAAYDFLIDPNYDMVSTDWKKKEIDENTDAIEPSEPSTYKVYLRLGPEKTEFNLSRTAKPPERAPGFPEGSAHAEYFDTPYDQRLELHQARRMLTLAFFIWKRGLNLYLDHRLGPLAIAMVYHFCQTFLWTMLSMRVRKAVQTNIRLEKELREFDQRNKPWELLQKKIDSSERKAVLAGIAREKMNPANNGLVIATPIVRSAFEQAQFFIRANMTYCNPNWRYFDMAPVFTPEHQNSDFTDVFVRLAALLTTVQRSSVGIVILAQAVTKLNYLQQKNILADLSNFIPPSKDDARKSVPVMAGRSGVAY